MNPQVLVGFISTLIDTIPSPFVSSCTLLIQTSSSVAMVQYKSPIPCPPQCVYHLHSLMGSDLWIHYLVYMVYTLGRHGISITYALVVIGFATVVVLKTATTWGKKSIAQNEKTSLLFPHDAVLKHFLQHHSSSTVNYPFLYYVTATVFCYIAYF